ncbi:hypothetical protein QBC34DRAFT_200288 [Podospora aff. communis PSN243]|uniref:Uncharacterized protein n=1 Tax=Podospora aff. communis PSN243 TaxID=3040156 RepID=A0AAV9G5Y0_9PEZI|nr:hypothetical protein QBC34DRAFT_200288 [Podospora aff. communis PSN243]
MVGLREEGGSVLRQGDEHPDWEELKPSAQPAIARSAHGSRSRGRGVSRRLRDDFAGHAQPCLTRRGPPMESFERLLADNLMMPLCRRSSHPSRSPRVSTVEGCWRERMPVCVVVTCWDASHVKFRRRGSHAVMRWGGQRPLAQPSPTSSPVDRTVPRTNPEHQRPICSVAPNGQRCRHPARAVSRFATGRKAVSKRTTAVPGEKLPV